MYSISQRCVDRKAQPVEEKSESPHGRRLTGRDRKLSRPLCAYPTLARHKGGSDPADAGSLECR